MFFDWLKNRRRRRWLAQREPSDWGRWLESNVWQYAYLSSEQRAKLHQFVCVLFHEKNWEGGAGFEVTDEMRVTVAGQAALATLGFGSPYYFDRLVTIILYEDSFTNRTNSDKLLLGDRLQPSHDFTVRTGELWQGGPIILSWNAVLKEGRHLRAGHNVVLHEFAHLMDSLNGQTDGEPPLTDSEFAKKWYRITKAEYRQLVAYARRGQPTLLNHYGATSHAEFFAVATECFFTLPHDLAAEHADLYTVLQRLFGQDPREWIPRSLGQKVS